jgi:hypothetical protein
MASIWLDRYECRKGELPPVCMVCGAEATGTRKITFRWCPPWVIVLILAGILIWAIVSIILTKSMTVYAPVCSEHRNHWFKRKAIAWGLLLSMLAVVVAGIALSIAEANNPQYRDLGFMFSVGGAIGFILALIVAAIVISTGIKPSEISDREIQLTRVNAGFVDAVREQRWEERERERARRRERAVAYEDEKGDDWERIRE